ncbi:MAG: GHMP kinase [Candidatus Jorgensenbacteria bacterium GW2011_GWC1_48_8]|uniref:GHMP kinase n=1 Tax=Candidatus Jorgensenbacteria bacterium GW2011_GWC1_48_8 TaxID=1618666 RepID=A0A0G1XW59_9BACT|nr:MAG: GHMP kinase [Parcubacteria group bacterium GW2011_GWB1_45_10]KKU98550.1 MAG: GHMP kinase [Candidatus Jorgensenbacteria bacterium GW2011_GWC1_48_8]
MILVRAPLRVSFVGGGTDLPDFYKTHPGRVLSATINKFVYVLINPTPLIDKFTVKYQKTEFVSHPSELEHTRIKAALLDLNFVKSGLEIGSFADLPAKTGLGSSSSFSVALLKGLYAYDGKNLNKTAAAEAASRLEIELIKEPIGKQDQYAASFGGFNIFQFNSNNSVDVEPILVDYQKKSDLEKHTLLFFTGITRPASIVLSEQRSKIEQNFETYKKMADSVYDFKDKLLKGDLRGMAAMLHEGWQRKRMLASNISNSLINDLYEGGLNAGAWGGKILGAGGGGCFLFIAPPEKQNNIRESMRKIANQNQLTDFKEIPVRFINSGTDILLNNQHQTGLV